MRGSQCVFFFKEISFSREPCISSIKSRIAKKASREVGIFFFSVFNFSLTRMYQRRLREKKLFSKIMKKKRSPSRPFVAHLAGGQETTFYLRIDTSGWGANFGALFHKAWVSCFRRL